MKEIDFILGKQNNNQNTQYKPIKKVIKKPTIQKPVSKFQIKHKIKSVLK